MALEDLGRKVELAWLAAFYGALLTENQRRVLSLHCEEDMSLSEIAETTGISRQGVHETLNRAAEKLRDMENRLHLAARFQRVEEGLIRCRASLAAGRLNEAETVLDELIRLEQEESNGL